MKTAKIIIMAVWGVLALSVASSRGQTLNLGTGAVLVGDLTNQTLVDSASGANDGIISSWVVSDSSVDSSGNIFIYQLKNEGPDQVTSASFGSFAAAGVGSIPGTGVYSNIVANDSFSLPDSLPPTVTLYPNFTFDEVTEEGAASFNQDPGDSGLDIGDVSWFIVIDTDVSEIGPGEGYAQDMFQAHSEILAVPETSSAVISLAGLACFYTILRWRRTIG